MPYIVSYGLLIVWSCIQAICKQDRNIPIRHLLSMLWGNVEIIGRSTSFAYLGGIYITHTWFLLAMFWGLIFLFLLHSMPKSYLWICIVISWFASWLYPYLKMCPWCILQGFGALSFLAIGQWLRTHKLPIAFWILCVFCWLIVIVVKPFSLSMVGNDYGCYPLNILAGLGGSYVLYYLAKWINQFAFSRKLWISVGTISLPILCFHEIEPLTDIYNSISLRFSDYVQIPQMLGVMIRYTCVIIFAYICVKTPILKKIYGRNDS